MGPIIHEGGESAQELTDTVPTMVETRRAPSRVGRGRKGGTSIGEPYFAAMAAVLLVIVFAGFAPTLYLRPVFGGPPFPAYLLYLHGGALSAWFLWLVMQSTLIPAGHVRLHRRLGVAGAGISAAVVIFGVFTLYRAVPRRVALGVDVEANVWALAALLWTNLSSLVAFALFVSLALRLRLDGPAHKRLMLLASISLTPAALTRIGAFPKLQVLDSQPANIVGFAFLSLLCLLSSLVVYDLRSRGRPHVVTAWSAPGYLLFWILSLFVIPATPPGRAAVEWLAR